MTVWQLNMDSDDEWKQRAIQRDILASARKLGKGKNTVVVLLYNIKSLGEDKLLQLEIEMDMYEKLAECGINFDDFSKGEKLFEDDREKFMNLVSLIKARAEIVDKVYKMKNNEV